MQLEAAETSEANEAADKKGKQPIVRKVKRRESEASTVPEADFRLFV